MRLRERADWSGSMLVANPLCWFCRNAAQILSFLFQIDYAKRREENLRLNREFLSQFGLDKV
jgi:hypothetical protein